MGSARKKQWQIAILSIIFLSAVGVAAAENWPHWRGPRNNGTSLETGLPIQWSSSENVLWRLPLPGAAGATPVVWEDRIFLTSAEGNDLVLLCINTNGKILWKRTLGTGNRNVHGGEGNAASPSPSTDGKHVWAFISTGDLACYDFDGNEVWKTNLEDRYGDFNLYFVMASTPLLDGDRLYLQLIHSNAWLVLALDKSTGREIWKHNRKSDAYAECEHSYASPSIYQDDKREFLLVHGADYITAHRLTDGSEIWRCGNLNPKNSYNTSLRLVASPVAVPGLVVVPSAKNGPVIGLRPGGKGDITGSKRWYHWQRADGTPDVPSPLIHEGLVYLCRENGDLICLDAETGKQVYKERTHRHRHRASPVCSGGNIYLTSRDGRVTVVKSGRNFEVLASNDIDETISASPVISNGKLYLRSYKALYAIGVAE
ncbi:MAG: PQQ-binding-like beta-propeller repeat protein [Candidatus Poribacteria bacterium]|nr:PQQ-binding-like beta-propeller repeat protein [Candidatus Poribacteria bacterium]